MTIRVTDVNDNSPVFFRPSYNARISETAHNNDPINVDDNLQVRKNKVLLVSYLCDPQIGLGLATSALEDTNKARIILKGDIYG